MIEMCLGFLFDNTRRHVLLIKKQRPEWQAGLYNGIGGKLESVDQGLPFKAMCREAEEEVGSTTIGWRPYCILEVPPSVAPVEEERFALAKRIHVFAACNTVDFERAHQKTDEEPQRFSLHPGVAHVGAPLIQWALCISNLRWLIPMASDTSIDPANPYVVQING